MKLDELRRLLGDVSWSGDEGEQRSIRLRMREYGMDWGGIFQEMEMSSRFVDAHRDVTYSSGVVSLHSHSFYEVLHCENNCGAEYLLGAERYRLQRGDVVFVPPGVSHRPILPENMAEPYRREVLWLSAEYVARMEDLFPALDLAPGDPLLLRTAGTAWESVGELFRDLVREGEERSDGWQAVLAGGSTVLLVSLQRMLAAKEPVHRIQAEKQELLELVLAYIETNLAGQITLADTARHFWVSESTVSQTFRRKMGVSFYRCVTQRRLIAAKSMILQGVPLGEINEQVGFSDYSTFYRAFKREFGISPREFRSLK